MDMKKIADLKPELRSVVISSPTPVNVSRLLRDYRELSGGEPLPMSKFGYSDAVAFLKDHFSDCFIFEGNPRNPSLVPIVPDTVKHIDRMVSKQRMAPKDKFYGRRRSVQQGNVTTHTTPQRTAATQYKSQPNQHTSQPMAATHHKSQPMAANQHTSQPMAANQHTSQPNQHTSQPIAATHHKSQPLAANHHRSQPMAATHHTPQQVAVTPTKKAPTASANGTDNLRRETSLGRQQRVRAQMHEHVRQLLDEHPEGIWCVDLMALYKGRFGVVLMYQDAGHTSLISFVRSMCEDVLIVRPEPTGDWRLHSPQHPPPPMTPPPPPPDTNRWLRTATKDDPFYDDALNCGDDTHDVFPEDCAQPGQQLPPLPMGDVHNNMSLQVIVGEMYSPSHVWLLRLGKQYYEALMQLTDDMNEYYGGGEGRRLSAGATRVGHLCAKLYCNDWHRAIIVQVLDDTRVKLRHVDYGTVEEADTSQLMALHNKWTGLPAQAVRARLAGLRPAAGGHVWPVEVTTDALRMVADKSLHAECQLRDETDGSLQVVLHTEGTCVNWNLAQLGLAQLEPPSSSAASNAQKSYHMPPFAALEDALTLSYSEVVETLNRGLSPWYMEQYSKYMIQPLPPSPEPPQLRLTVGNINLFRFLKEVDGNLSSEYMARCLDTMLPHEGPYFEFL